MRHPILQRPFLALLALLVFCTGAADGATDVEVTLTPTGKGRPQEGTARGVIAAPPERVARAVADLAHWHEFMPFLTASDARPQSDGSVLSEQRLALPFPLGSHHYRIRFQSRSESGAAGPVWRAEWSYVPGSGDIAGLRGSWTLEPAPGGATLATCRLWTDPGSVSALLMDRATAKSLLWIFDGLRQHVRRSRYD
jgi:hypothetical protein